MNTKLTADYKFFTTIDLKNITLIKNLDVSANKLSRLKAKRSGLSNRV